MLDQQTGEEPQEQPVLRWTIDGQQAICLVAIGGVVVEICAEYKVMTPWGWQCIELDPDPHWYVTLSVNDNMEFAIVIMRTQDSDVDSFVAENDINVVLDALIELWQNTMQEYEDDE